MVNYAIYIDYDDKPLEWVERKAVELSRKFNLGDVEIRVSDPTKNPPHLHIYFEKRVKSPEQVRAVLRESECHKRFLDYAEVFSFTVIRKAASRTKHKPQPLKKLHVEVM